MALPNLHTYAGLMQLGKTERQRLIESLVSRKRIGTQFELLDALADAGCVVTQATVSRDIRQLGLEKTHDPFGRPRYVLPHVARRADPTEVLNSILGQFGRKVTPAGNVVVLQSELGSAPAIARALDQLEHERIVGTLAGDDTVLVVAPSERDAKSLARELADVSLVPSERRVRRRACATRVRKFSPSGCECVGASTAASARRTAPAPSGRISALVAGSSNSPRCST